jgi:glycosyltransferase involved in cell wall biosynthesis
MDVYADGLVSGLKAVRPEWDIAEIAPQPWSRKVGDWQGGLGIRKYYERFWNHPRAVRQQSADIIHIIDHSSGHVAYWLHDQNKRQSDQRVVITCHDLVQLVYPEILRDQARFPALSLALWQYSMRGMYRADHVIAVSSNTAADMTRLLQYPTNQITVVPNAVDSQFCQLPQETAIAYRQQHCPQEQAICLLNVGTTHQRKNLLTVLKVLHTLKEKGVPVYLWRVGDALTEPQQQYVKTHQLQDAMIDFGKPNKEKLIQIYNAADVLLAPSLYEGFGLTILEAMACGLPVITSNVSSLPEVAGNAAILVDPLNESAIVEAICRLHSDFSLRSQLREQGLERVKQFSWENTGKQTAHVYESLIGGS